MYKFISSGIVVDVVKDIRYLRYLKKSKHVVGSDKSSANCVQASNGIDVYGIQGKSIPEYLNYQSVIIRQVDEIEYNQLKQLLESKTKILADSTSLHEARTKKIQSLESDCKRTIIDGIVVKLSDGDYHQFELTVEDQLNLSMIQSKLNCGATGCIYHEKGKVCRYYEADDLLIIIQSANKHIEYNTTYFNLMKNCIYNMYNVEEIEDIRYGDTIPNSSYADILNHL